MENEDRDITKHDNALAKADKDQDISKNNSKQMTISR